MAIERAALTVVEWASAGDQLPRVKGWASTYDNADRFNRVHLAGAFGKAEASFEVPLLAYHQDGLPIGGATLTPKASYGLRGDAGLANVDFARDIAALIAAKAIPATSIGWDTTEAEFTIRKSDGARLYSRTPVVEWSVCPIPANPLALIEAASLTGTGAPPAWERDLPEWARALWPDFARDFAGLDREVIRIGSPVQVDAAANTAPMTTPTSQDATDAPPAADQEVAVGQFLQMAHDALHTAHQGLVAAGAPCTYDQGTPSDTAAAPPRDTAAVAGSWEEVQMGLGAALSALYPEPSYTYIRATYDDSIVYEVSGPAAITGTWRMTYAIDADDDIEFGEPERVKLTEVVTAAPADDDNDRGPTASWTVSAELGALEADLALLEA